MWKLQGSVYKKVKNETCIHNLILVCSIQLPQTYPGHRLFNFIILSHACGDCACTDVCVLHACQVLWRPDEALLAPLGSGITDSCESTWGCWGWNLSTHKGSQCSLLSHFLPHLGELSSKIVTKSHTHTHMIHPSLLFNYNWFIVLKYCFTQLYQHFSLPLCGSKWHYQIDKYFLTPDM